jgi:hypothetical protein
MVVMCDCCLAHSLRCVCGCTNLAPDALTMQVIIANTLLQGRRALQGWRRWCGALSWECALACSSSAQRRAAQRAAMQLMLRTPPMLLQMHLPQVQPVASCTYVPALLPVSRPSV